MIKNSCISLYLDRKVLRLKLILGVFVASLALLSLLTGCASDDVFVAGDTGSKPTEAGKPEVEFSMQLRGGVSQPYLDNALIYVFRDTDNYVERKRNIKVGTDRFTMRFKVGTWNLALLSCDQNIESDIITPAYDAVSSVPMWKTGFTDNTNAFLKQTPGELRFDMLKNVEIKENETTKTKTVLNRNVAKVQVILNPIGFDPFFPSNVRNDSAFVELLSVPTTLNWRGEYYPSKNAPEHSGDVPIREYLYSTRSANKVDTVNFIIPAHRGTDAFAAVHKDTTNHKLRLRLCMPLNGQLFYGKTKVPVTISIAPKINRIIQLRVNFRAQIETELDVQVSVKDWEDPIYQDEVFD